jgi:hypothetical protein
MSAAAGSTGQTAARCALFPNGSAAADFLFFERVCVDSAKSDYYN